MGQIVKWADIAFTPDPDTAREAYEAWAWLIDEPWRALICSMFGGLFLEKQSGGVYWLECGTGRLERVADDAAEFDLFITGKNDEAWKERIDEWFLPTFVEQLHEAGKRPGPDQCYGLTILPIFKEGKYTVENVFVLPRREWLTFTGSIHKQIKDVPDGRQVKIVVKP